MKSPAMEKQREDRRQRKTKKTEERRPRKEKSEDREERTGAKPMTFSPAPVEETIKINKQGQ